MHNDFFVQVNENIDNHKKICHKTLIHSHSPKLYYTQAGTCSIAAISLVTYWIYFLLLIEFIYILLVAVERRGLKRMASFRVPQSSYHWLFPSNSPWLGCSVLHLSFSTSRSVVADLSVSASRSACDEIIILMEGIFMVTFYTNNPMLNLLQKKFNNDIISKIISNTKVMLLYTHE